VDLIYEGEDLSHVPSFLAFWEWYSRKYLKDDVTVDGIEPPEIPVDPSRPQDIVTDIFSQAGNVNTALDIVTLALEFTSFAAAGAVLTVLSQVFFVAGAVYDLVQAHEVDVRIEEYYASAYAATAWVYDDLHKTPPLQRPANSISDAPQLRFPVPDNVANTNRWRQRLAFDSDRDNEVLKRVNAWEETTQEILDRLDQKLDDMRTFVTGPDFRGPNFTIEDYRRELQTFVVPDNDSNPALAGMVYWLNRREYFRLYIAGLKKHLGDMGSGVEKRMIDSESRRFPMPVRSPTSTYP
jgi:hypothetical protein